MTKVGSKRPKVNGADLSAHRREWESRGIDYGLCLCGCGADTEKSQKTDRAAGHVAGEPRFCRTGHRRALLPDEIATRFWKHVEKHSPDSCWIWTATRKHGSHEYGEFTVGGIRYVAHRFAFEIAKGPIPDGHYLDHLCRNPPCVNPAHLEPVTPRENVLRGLKGRMVTHCPKGHPYDDKNTIWVQGRRHCRECRKAYFRKRHARGKAASK
jgi:hypothetical protein